MVTRLFSSKSSSGSGRSGDKTSTQSQQVPPPPPPASHKPKSPYTPLVSKPPRRRPTNLPLLQPNSQPQHGEKLTPSPSYKTEHNPPYSSKTPPASTFRNNHQPHPLHFPRHQPRQQISPRGCPMNPQVANRLPHSQASTSQHSQHSFNQPNPTDNGGPTYGYLDLTRARSDESLLWTAEEEASALVAELRASLNCNNTNSDNSINCVGRHSVVYFGGDDSSSAGHRGLNPYHHAKQGHPNGLPALNPHQRHDNGSAFRNPASSVIQGGSLLSEQDPDRPSVSGVIHPAMGVRLPNPFQRSFSVHKRSSEARAAAQKLNHSPPLRSHSFTDLQSAVELMPLQNGSSHGGRPSPVGGSNLGESSGLGGSGSLGDSGAPDPRHGLGCGLPLKTFGGSWKSLLRVGAMSSRSSGKPPGAGIKKVAPPTVPGHHHMQHLQHHSSSSHSDPSTPSHTPTQTPTHVPSSHTMQHHLTIAPGPPSAAPDTPTSSTGSASNYRHSGSSFHSSSTASSGVFSGADQRASFSSSIGSSEDAVSTHSSNPPPSPCSPSSGSSSLDSGARGPTGRLSCATTGGASPSHCPSTASGGQQFAFPPPPSGTHAGAPQFAHLLCKSQPPPHSPHHQPPPPHGAEDQGIDVASPVRSGSPGSGSGSSSGGSSSTGCCRHSTTSLDSGRASATTQHHHHHHHHPHHQHRLSGQSYDSGGGGAGSSGSGSLRHSYHSSSSSLGSIESPHLNVADLLNNGVRDCEVLRAWLTELHLEEHTDQFMNAGYDMPTISRMTPEDLNAIGVTKPAHRKKLKTEITRLNISDGLPDYIPATLEEWLLALRLSEYHTTLQRQGYCSPLQMLQVMWEDLEEMGITRLGHQKKVMLAIKRIKDIKGGKKFSSTLPPQPPPPQEIVAITRDCPGETYSGLADLRTFAGQRAAQSDCYPPRAPPSEAYAVHRSASESYASSYNCNSGPSAMTVGAYNPNGAQFSPSVYRSYAAAHHGVVPGSPLHRQNSQHGSHSSNNNSANNIISSNKLQHHSQYAGHGGPPGSNSHTAIQYRPDFVTVQVHPQVRRNKDGVFEEPIYTTFHPENNRFSQQYPPQHPQQLHLQQQQSNQFSSLPPRPSLPPIGNSYPPRSLDDGDITPTNEIANYEGGGTLPRHRASGNKFRPVAKVTAKTRVEVHQEMNQNEKSPPPNAPEYIKDNEMCVVDGGLSNGCLKQSENIVNANKVENIYNMIHAHSTNNTPQGTPKKLPPPPPRRSNSISETSKVDSLNNSNNLKHGIHNTLPSSHPNSLSTSGQGGGSANSTVTGAAATQSRESQYGFLRRGLNYGYMGVKNNLQPDIASDLPPPPPAPNDVGNHQHILHHHSHRRPQQQMLPSSPEHQCEEGHTGSAKSSGNQREGSGNGKKSHEAGAKEEDDFPPPPPPLAASGAASTGGKEGVGNGVGELDGAVITRPRRNDSTVSNCSHKSTSSTDSSDSLPFANDNAGTIKQRYTTSGSAPPLPSLPPHLHASPLSSPHASPSALRRTGPLRTSLHKGGPCSTPVRTGAANSSDETNTDVLSDIGNMLANLTDELDAMLEQEMVT